MCIPVVELPDITICEEQSNQAEGLNCRDKQIEDEAKYALHEKHIPYVIAGLTRFSQRGLVRNSCL